ncbi:MAG TPA: hypothetical protein EYP61_06655 [Candidatus Latescibacteria bacterium]|nr:hypothetical protein [Candidatus Latescibacterota bacterium]
MVVLLIVGLSLAQDKGYTLLWDRVMVHGKDQWKAWSYPRDVVVFGEDGSVGPRYLRKPVNACLNAGNFSHDGQRGGIRAAGCREEQAKNLVQDRVTFYYDILQLTRRVPCSVEVYELSGAPVRELFKGMRSSGRYRDTWDGRDGEGKLVPPGVYLVRVRVRTDSGTEVRVVPVSVVY